MGTEINKNLTQFAGKTGIEYQLTTFKKNSGTSFNFSWITLTKEEMDKLVIAYLKFKLIGETDE